MELGCDIRTLRERSVLNVERALIKADDSIGFGSI